MCELPIGVNLDDAGDMIGHGPKDDVEHCRTELSIALEQLDAVPHDVVKAHVLVIGMKPSGAPLRTTRNTPGKGKKRGGGGAREQGGTVTYSKMPQASSL